MLIKLIYKNIKNHKHIAIISIITVFILSISLILLNWILENSIYFLQNNFGTNQNKFIIQATSQTFSLFNFSSTTLDKVYKELQNNPHISKIWGIYVVKAPTQLQISLGEFNFITDIAVFASDKGDLCFSGKYLAAGINPNIINLYNLQASSSSYPKISLNLLKNIYFKLIFGKNSFSANPHNLIEKVKIISINRDLPLLGITIGYKPAKEIIKQIGGSIKLIKIVGYVKQKSYLNTLTKKYPNFKITTFNNFEKQLSKKIYQLKKLFFLIKIGIFIILASFLIILVILIKEKNKNIEKTLINNLATKKQVFLVVYGEVIIYILFSFLLICLTTYLINSNLSKIEKTLENQGLIIKLLPIKF